MKRIYPLQVFVWLPNQTMFLQVIIAFEKVEYLSNDSLCLYIHLYLANDDNNRDADLMADSLLERKDRFLCITRMWPLVNMRTPGSERNLILEDVKLINERETPPQPYTSLAYTYDTREKGTAKRLICVKMAERQAGMKCICDIIFLYRTKRPPQYYTIIGEINSLQMCVREGSVPPMTISPTNHDPQSNLYPNPLTGTSYQTTHQRRPSMDNSNTNTLSKKTDEKEVLDGIPFEINSKYLNEMRKNQQGNGLTGLESFRILSPYEIDQYFNYDFHIERSSL